MLLEVGRDNLSSVGEVRKPNSKVFPCKNIRVAISFSGGSSQPRDESCLLLVSYVGRQILYHRATWEAPFNPLVTTKHYLYENTYYGLNVYILPKL